jgi:D-arginine dehydrogenase
VTACDVVVIGGGIAGASAAYEIAIRRKVVLLERESACGYHSTGRSAASYTENYGTTVIRRLAKASRRFLEAPPVEFADRPLMQPRGSITIARDDQRARLAAALARGREFAPDMREIDADEACRRVPILRRDYVAAAIEEPGSQEIDVHAMHQGFLKGLRARGGRIVTGAEVTALARRGDSWQVTTAGGTYNAAIVVNAAGAWADRVGALAGAAPIGLVPKRRTAFLVEPPAGVAIAGWPMIDDAGEEFYFKADAGRIFVSPADATPSEPTDAQAEEIDIAIGVDRFERATTVAVRRIAHKWAGLRSFVADGSPVVGADSRLPGFFWLAAQGGYGIKTSPALSRAIAGLIERGKLPDDLRQFGLREQDISPRRCQLAAVAAPASDN